MAGQKNRKLLHAARAQAERYAAEHPMADANPVQVLQFILSRRLAALKHAIQKAEALREDDMFKDGPFGTYANEWVRLEQDLAQEVATLCIQMERVGLAERLVSLQEAQATLLVRALTEAAQEAGIPRAQLRELGPAFRRHLTLLQGGVVEGGAEAA